MGPYSILYEGSHPGWMLLYHIQLSWNDVCWGRNKVLHHSITGLALSPRLKQFPFHDNLSLIHSKSTQTSPYHHCFLPSSNHHTSIENIDTPYLHHLPYHLGALPRQKDTSHLARRQSRALSTSHLRVPGHQLLEAPACGYTLHSTTEMMVGGWQLR